MIRQGAETEPQYLDRLAGIQKRTPQINVDFCTGSSYPNQTSNSLYTASVTLILHRVDATGLELLPEVGTASGRDIDVLQL